MNSSFEDVHETVARLVAEAESWPGVEASDHRFGGTELLLGPRELGHVHGWGMLDVPYLRALREALVGAGETGVHHLLTDSGWTTFYVRSADDYEQARRLLRLSYLYHVATLQRAGRREAPDVDVAAELDALEPSEEVRAAFERRRPTSA